MEIRKETPGIECATRIAASGFKQPISQALEDDVANHLAHGDLIYTLADETGEFGFALYNLWGEKHETLYLSGIILDEAHQGKRVFGQVTSQAKQESSATYLALRTQSLRMWAAGAHFCWSWYPSPPTKASEITARVKRSCSALLLPSSASLAPSTQMGRIPAYVRDQGEQTAQKLSSSFPVHVGCYGQALYGEKPVYHDASLQEWWDRLCDFDHGDAVICIGEIHMPAEAVFTGTKTNW
jgi:hypothetical protein